MHRGNICIGLLLTILSLDLDAQVEHRQPAHLEDPKFYVDALSFASGDTLSSRLDVFVQVPYDGLRFVKRGSIFIAQYEVTLDVFDSGQNLVDEKIWKEEVRVANFDQTISEQGYNLTQRHFTISPGKYTLQAHVRDKDSRKVFRLGKDIFVPTFVNRPLSMSDLMLVSRLTVDGEKKTIQPLVSGNVGNESEGFHLFFEIYNSTDLNEVELTYRVFNAKKELVLTKSLLESLQKGRNQLFVAVERSGLPLGDYTISVEARPVGDALESEEYKNLVAVSTRWMQVRWSGMPVTVNDLDLAIDQLVYLAKDSEVDHIKEAQLDDERMVRFREFWKRYDPSPNTVQNERMEEYYARVDYANKHFSHYIDGWKTDMGMVFVIFGSPNNVDRHPFDHDRKPYEVWSYYDINRQFVFVDETGFGDYRLVTPMWDLWDRRGRDF
ncbi:MAG: GWxTD domain-containing protein [Bacteroidota bacterium]